jgi:hypothetical protein
MPARKTQLMIDHPTEYTAWKNMKDCCYNQNSPTYPGVGATGIKVCDSWMKLGFEQFLKDVGVKPEGVDILTRRQLHRNFTPRNTYWATRAERGESQSRYRKRLAGEAKAGVKNLVETSKRVVKHRKLTKAMLAKSGIAFKGVPSTLPEFNTEQYGQLQVKIVRNDDGSMSIEAAVQGTTVNLSIDVVDSQLMVNSDSHVNVHAPSVTLN